MHQQKQGSPTQLTPRGIYKITREQEEEFILQAIHFKKMKSGNKISCELSDGVHKLKGFIADASVDLNDEGAILQVNSYGLLAKRIDQNNQQNDQNFENGRVQIMGVLVHVCKIIDHYDGIIGKPVDILTKQKTVCEIENPIYPKIDPHKLKLGPKSKTNGAIQKIQQNKKNVVTLQLQQDEEIDSDLVNDSQKISDLYTDLANWQIIAKVAKKNYKEFQSKSGKLTKVLNIQLMDNTGMKITGAMFGDASLQFHNALQQDQVYRISKGQIREDTFNQKKGANFSKFTIMFTRHSQFVKIPSGYLPEYQTKHETLSSILSKPKLNQQYDFKAILLDCHQQIELHKQTRTLIKQSIQLYDPQKQIIMEAVIWNKSVSIKQNLLGKVVGMYGWRLGKFNQNWSFNSGYNSELKVLQGSKRGSYSQFEGKLDLQAIRQKKLNKQQKDSKEGEKDQIDETQFKYLKDIEQQVFSDMKEVRSTVSVYISFLGYKKWYYDSCPYCRKSAEPQSKCNSCEKTITETIPKYKLNVELSDYTGSLWATGFEQFGQKIFADLGPNSIKDLLKLDENQLHVAFERNHFKQFILKLTSKIDRDGTSVMHTINKVYDINVATRLTENYKKIMNNL